jgi:hypothetical protein
VQIDRILAVGAGESGDDPLFPDDEDEYWPQTGDGNDLKPRYVRRIILTIRFEPGGELRPDLSMKLRTFVPNETPEEEVE